MDAHHFDIAGIIGWPSISGHDDRMEVMQNDGRLYFG